MDDHTIPTDILLIDEIPGRGVTLNPFVVVDDAAGLLTFVAEVFGARENTDARTPLPDGRLIHGEAAMGSATFMVCDRLDGWGPRPAFLQVWVRDVATVLARGTARGATVVTDPTPFYGETTLARMQDPWQNLWWLYSPSPGQPDPTPSWEGGSDVVFRTLDEHLRASSHG